MPNHRGSYSGCGEEDKPVVVGSIKVPWYDTFHLDEVNSAPPRRKTVVALASEDSPIDLISTDKRHSDYDTYTTHAGETAEAIVCQLHWLHYPKMSLVAVKDYYG